jgi:hypothetical protein
MIAMKSGRSETNRVVSEVDLAQSRRPSFLKRQKEQKRREKQRKKSEKKALRDAERKERPESAFNQDSDIAHIVPGPQPLPEDE